MTTLILQASLETFLIVFFSMTLGCFLGTPLAVLLSITKPTGLWPHPFLHHTLGTIINSIRSIPYIILIVFLVPLTQIIVGTSIGTIAALVPLTLAATLLIARVVEEALNSMDKGLIEVGISLGARKIDIILHILLYESLPRIVSGLTTVMINIIGFSAMAGTVGGGGLGDLAIRYGYQRYDFTTLIIIVSILLVFVQLIQMLGDKLSSTFRK